MNVKNMVKNQQHIFNILKTSKSKDRLSHAYLFYGDEGVGKKEMAYALATLLYCPNGGCLECETCQKILEGKHLNVEYIGVLENKKLISKEQITELQEEFSKTSLIDGYRIYIVDGIDTASASAQNSLLKFIEEPINNTPTIGIFIANELANVVSTIVSRCAFVHFPSIDTKVLISMLEHEGLDSLDASLSSIVTNNSEEAMLLTEDINFKKAKELFMQFLSIKTKKDAVLLYVNSVNSLSSEIVNLFFKWLIAFYEDIFKIEDKEGLILRPLYDKILVHIKDDHKSLKKKFSLILELHSKLEYNVSSKNILHELISKYF